ncbi:MAG: hypothetical protein ACYTG1_02140 [Planctomycetota bacterium]|jgi:hypothetical protein
MWNLVRELDRILRGEATRPRDLREGTVRIPTLGITCVIVALGVIYGVCMSGYSVVNRRPFDLAFVLAPALKVPALFFLTLVVTFPSLYVFNALVGSRLNVAAVARLIIAALAVTLAVLASFGPIAAFFAFTTKSYPFMVLLNVVIFAVSGVLGLAFLLQTLHRLAAAGAPPRPSPPAADEADVDDAPPAADPAPLDRMEEHVLGPHVRTVFRVWVIVFGLVGAQMAWVLRPFLGHPDSDFVWFRARESNFFQAVWQHALQLFT